MKRKTTKCDKCNKEISLSNYKRHYNVCKGEKENFFIKEEWRQENDKYKCPHCNKDFVKKGIATHIWRMHTNEGIKFDPNKGYDFKGRISWNKGLTKETDFRLKKQGLALHKKYKERKIKPSFLGRKHSEETKKRISEKRIKFLNENPDKVPYLLNHSSKGPSYPELYFIDLFEKENILLHYHKQIGLYQLDFYNENKKVYVEIDGEQHYLDNKIANSDLKRKDFLSKLEWKEFRVRWSNWKKISLKEKKIIINEIKNLL